MTIEDIAHEIYVELGSPTDNSEAAIQFWLQSKVGEVNNLIFEDFLVDPNINEIVDGDGTEIDIYAASIFKKFYKVYYYEIQIRQTLNALITDTILEVTDNGSSVRKVNRNEVSKTLAALKKEEQSELEKLITAYKLKKSSPSQVAGDDTIGGCFPHYITNPLIRRNY